MSDHRRKIILECFVETKIGPHVISMKKKIINAPTQHLLGQNFPNPFNAVTVIRYSLLHDDNVKLTIFNSIEEEVKILVNEHQHTGTYHVRFDASEFEGGLYSYKLETENFTSMRRMLFIK